MTLSDIRLIAASLLMACTPQFVTAQAAPQQSQAIEMIDATQLTVAELMALAAAERDAPTALSCCDWSGSGDCAAHSDSPKS